MEQILSSNYPYLLVLGGDGTLHYLINLLRQKDPSAFHRMKLILWPAGTMNLVWHALFAAKSQSPLTKAIQLQKWICSNKNSAKNSADTRMIQQSVHSLDVNGRICFVFGGALISRFIRLYNKQKKPGSFEAARILLWAAFSWFLQFLYDPLNLVKRKNKRSRLYSYLARRLNANIRFVSPDIKNEIVQKGNFSLLLVQSIPNLYRNFRIAFSAGRQKATFHAIFSQISPATLVFYLFHFLFGLKLSRSEIYHGPVDELILEPSSREIYMIDGEIFPSSGLIDQNAERSIHIKAGPELEISYLAKI